MTGIMCMRQLGVATVSSVLLGSLAACGGAPHRSESSERTSTQLGVFPSKVAQPRSVLDSLYALARPASDKITNPSLTKEHGSDPALFDHSPPARNLLTMHALAVLEKVPLYAGPDLKSEKMGFLRLGSRLRVTASQGDAGCPGGWFQLAHGAFACASKGLTVGTTPPAQPFEPRLGHSAHIPYTWARVQSERTPLWSSLPSKRELARARKIAAKLEQGSISAKQSPPRPLLSAQGPGSALPLDGELPWLAKDYLLSLDRPVEHIGRRFWRTSRGAYVQADTLADHQGQDFRGQYLPPGKSLQQIAFVGLKGSPSRIVRGDGNWEEGPRIPARRAVEVFQRASFDGTQWSRIEEDLWLPSDALIQARNANMPAQVASDEKWLDLDLSRQTLVAYRGASPVYFTLMSSGVPELRGQKSETPVGKWRIYSKEKSSDMSTARQSDSSIFIQDVPWVMYFSDSYAIHGAFWHERFGQPSSPGGINLGPSDARWLFSWTSPQLPLGWHGVLQSRLNPGTLISIRGITPPQVTPEQQG